MYRTLPLLMFTLVACAEGFHASLDDAGAAMPGEVELPMAGMEPAGTGPAAGIESEPCMRGETMPCQCPAGVAGIRQCDFDAASPTQGSFGMCVCSEPEAGDGASSGTGAGRGSNAGTAAAGAAGTAAGTGTDGGSGGLSGGAGVSGGAGAGGSDPMRPAWCIFVPVPIPGC